MTWLRHIKSYLLYTFNNFRRSSNRRCNHTHIPERLHWNCKFIIKKFFDGEEIYRRSPLKSMADPYKDISLYDLSVNRQGHPKNPISKCEDVLLNVSNAELGTHYKDYGIIILRIVCLIPKNKYIRKFEVTDEGKTDIIIMKLKHDPLPCMFPHSVFEFELNGEAVTKINYRNGLGKKNRKYSKLRQLCKAELTNILIKKIVDYQIGEPLKV